MKRQNYFLKFFAVFLAFCFLSVTVFSNITVSAQQDVNYENMTPEQKQLIGGLIIGVQLAGQMNRKEDH